MKKFNKKELEFHLPDNFKGLNKKYILDCIFNKEIQNKWKPNVGDIIVGETGNVFVISSKRDLEEELGGPLYFFGGYLASPINNLNMNNITCYVMNSKGFKFKGLNTYIVSSFSDFRYVSYPHEKKIINKLKDKNKTLNIDLKTNPICKIINDKLSWVLEVDSKKINFNGSSNADYFSEIYTNLGYTIEWDKNKWKQD